jgi:hypothetical protein
MPSIAINVDADVTVSAKDFYLYQENQSSSNLSEPKLHQGVALYIDSMTQDCGTGEEDFFYQWPKLNNYDDPTYCTHNFLDSNNGSAGGKVVTCPNITD